MSHADESAPAPQPQARILASELVELPLFRALAPELAETLAGLARVRAVEAGATVFREGDAGDAWFVVRSGHVRIVREGSAAPPVVLAILGPGDSFGEVAVFDARPRSATAVVDSAAELIVIARAALEGLLAERPAEVAGLLVAIIAGLGRTLRRATTDLVTVYETGRLIGSLREPAELAAAVLAEVHAATGADRSALGIWNELAGDYDWVGPVGPVDAPLEATDASLVRALEEGAPRLEDHEAVGDAPFWGRQSLVVPLLEGDAALGVVALAGDAPGRFGSDQRKLAEAVARQVSAALALAHHERDERDRQRLTRARERDAFEREPG